MKNKNQFLITGIILLVFIILSSFGTILDFITGFLWFDEIGYLQTYFTQLRSQFMIGIPMFLGLFGLFFFYVKRLLKKNYTNDKIIEVAGSNKKMNLFVACGSFVVSFFITIGTTSSLWLEILQFFNAKSFDITDPIFGQDISFYIFKLPLISSLVNTTITVLFLMIVVAVVVNVIGGLSKQLKELSGKFTTENPFNTQGQPINIPNFIDKKTVTSIINQISILGALLLVLFGIRIFLGSYDLLYSERGRVFGAGYTDVVVTLNVYRAMAVLCVAGAITFFIGARKRNLKIALGLPVVLIVVSILGNVGAGVVENFIVVPDQLSKEAEYIENNIKYTQLAYGLDMVEAIEFDVQDNLTYDDLVNNEDVIDNIKINDSMPLQQVYNKLQGIRPYYVFNDVDIDRYMIDGEYRQVYLSAREMDQNLLNEQAKTWINQYLKYTHGYGITLSPVNEVTPQGQPEMIIRDIPPITETDLEIDRPEIYFGESTNEYIIVNTEEKEFDYPSGSDNVESEYEGTAGIELGFLNKLLFAIDEGSYNMFISSNIDENSKIIINRNIMERVGKIAPFITFGSDPYIVLNQEDGKLYWIIEGFTTSTRYPYSQPVEGSNTNYIRNSVKVVIDAYNGDTNFYIADEKDPIVMTYNEIFTDLFKPMSEMPSGLKSHIRYSQELFNIQAEMYRTYHMENTTVFFGREDMWDIANQKYMSTEGKVIPNYYMFKLPDEEEIEFLLTIPYTPQGKDNMSAMLVARNDGENYGELLLYNFPKNKTIQGPALIESRIDQDTEISSQLTLWSQEGSSVLRGNTLVIPIENSILYVEPIYLQADTQSNFPEMKMVVVAYDDRIVMEPTLDEALNKIFGDIYEPGSDDDDKDDATDTDTGSTGSDGDNDYVDENLESLILIANTLLEESNEAIREGDWATYGEKQDELQNVLKSLEDLIGNNDAE